MSDSAASSPPPWAGSIEPHVRLLKQPADDQLLYKVMSAENLLRSISGRYLHFNRVDSYRDFPGADGNDGAQLPKDIPGNTRVTFVKSPDFPIRDYYSQSRSRTYACCFSLENSRYIWDEQEIIVRKTIEPTDGHNLFDELAAKSGKAITISNNDLDDLGSARLRGISATAEGLTGDSWVDLEVTCPQQHLKTADITLPPFRSRLGRVSSSMSLNVRDIAGARSIINRNPVTDWNVCVSRHYGGENLKLLHLDFHIAS